MLRMQTLNVVYQALRTADEPLTVSQLATDVDLTESRSPQRLNFSKPRGRSSVERADTEQNYTPLGTGNAGRPLSHLVSQAGYQTVPPGHQLLLSL